MNLLIRFSYNGSNYFGFQKQNNKKTIQGEIEEVLSKIFNYEIKINGSGRTDAKVHAINQYANFKVDELKYDLDDIKYKLNKMLFSDIYIKEIKTVDDEFNARLSAKRKIYEYYVTNKKENITFYKDLLTQINFDIDLDKMEYIKKYFIGEHNFMNFTAKPEDFSNFIRTIYSIKIEKLDNDIYKLRFEGNGFMTYEVRMIVANIVLFSSNKIGEDEIKNKLNSQIRDITSYCFPPEGLYLYDVIY